MGLGFVGLWLLIPCFNSLFEYMCMYNIFYWCILLLNFLMVFSCKGWVWLNDKHRCVVQSIVCRFLSTHPVRYDTTIFTTFDARHCFSLIFSFSVLFFSWRQTEAESIAFSSSQGILAAISSPWQLSWWIPSIRKKRIRNPQSPAIEHIEKMHDNNNDDNYTLITIIKWF